MDIDFKNFEKMLIEEYMTNQNTVKVEDNEGNLFDMDQTKVDFLSEIFDTNFDKTEVRMSSKNGNGLFAKEFIPKGEVVTFFPGDFVRFHPDDSEYGAVFPSERQSKNSSHEEINKLVSYGHKINEDYSIFGNPKFSNDPSYLGHFINDGAKPNSNPKSHGIYLSVSKMTANCDFKLIGGLHLAIITTKDIKKDDELFITYGLDWWKRQ